MCMSCTGAQALHEELALLAAASSSTRSALLEQCWFFLGLMARSLQLAQLTAFASVPGARSDDEPPPDAPGAPPPPQLCSPQFLADLSALVSLVCREFVDAFANIVQYNSLETASANAPNSFV